jgi:hypothetical protein
MESDLLSHGSGNSFGTTVRRAFEDMMLMQRQGSEIMDINKFEIRMDPYKTAVRPPWTPPNNPKIQKGNIVVDGTASENETPGSNGRK